MLQVFPSLRPCLLLQGHVSFSKVASSSPRSCLPLQGHVSISKAMSPSSKPCPLLQSQSLVPLSKVLSLLSMVLSPYLRSCPLLSHFYPPLSTDLSLAQMPLPLSKVQSPSPRSCTHPQDLISLSKALPPLQGPLPLSKAIFLSPRPCPLPKALSPPQGPVPSPRSCPHIITSLASLHMRWSPRGPQPEWPWHPQSQVVNVADQAWLHGPSKYNDPSINHEMGCPVIDLRVLHTKLDTTHKLNCCLLNSSFGHFHSYSAWWLCSLYKKVVPSVC